MSFFTALYNLLIGPLELFFEVLYSMVNRVVNHPGLSIIFLSLAMNFLVLPLYKMSDAMQAEEATTEAKLKPAVTHIKKTFKGDERFMILQMYYRENHYKPSDALKGSVSLLLEIPFFMAAYNFLSGLSILHGASLGPISNLAAPDAMLVIGGIAINVLPILMTVINLVSSAIYTRGASTRSKVQLYVMAGLFLVLLYDSPSGLVFYWTLNNLFSLVKNVFMKLKNPKKVFCWLCSVIGAAALIFVAVTHPMPTARSQFLLCCLTLMFQLPLVYYIVASRWPRKKMAKPVKVDSKTFWTCGLFLTVLTGLFIPSGVISASPEEFFNTATQTNPVIFIINATLTAAGFFLIWFGMFYLLAKNSGKKWMGYIACVLSLIAITDFMFFGKDHGTLTVTLAFNTAPVFNQQLINILVLVPLCAVVFLIWRKKQELLRFIFTVSTVAAVIISVLNVVSIQNTVSEKLDKLENKPLERPSISLSQSGKNVIVLMADRGVGAYVPYLLQEKPELREQFSGFTYYPNTVSFGPCTNIGAPALFGGYEYTPEEMNNRSDESLEEKTNEALKVMPVAFLNQGYRVTVCDPPCAGYDWVPDLSIYDDYPEIKAYNSMGYFNGLIDPLNRARNIEARLNRNLFCYSIMKTVPVCVQPYLYNGGTYNDVRLRIGQVINANKTAVGLNTHFIHAYEVLNNLESITEIHPGTHNTFLMMANDTTHEPTLLQKPGYIPAEQVDNTAYDAEHPFDYEINGQTLKMDTEVQVTHYHVNMAAFLELGEWFDYLREQNVYDNCRIIIVADHGAIVNQIDQSQFGANWNDDILSYNPMLLVKDFNGSGFTTDPSFMTNADTPYLAMDGLIDNPVNPFTNECITDEAKLSGPQHIFCSHNFDIRTNNGTVFLPDPWYSVHDNIFDLNNWEYLGER